MTTARVDFADVHKVAAYRIAREAAEKAGHAHEVAKLARRQLDAGDFVGAEWSGLLAQMLHSDVDAQLEQVRALRAEAEA